MGSAGYELVGGVVLHSSKECEQNTACQSCFPAYDQRGETIKKSEITGMAKQMEAHRVSAYNTSKFSENKIHDDTVARRYGFSGGLVPGVDVLAYMLHVGGGGGGGGWGGGGVVGGGLVGGVYGGEVGGGRGVEEAG